MFSPSPDPGDNTNISSNNNNNHEHHLPNPSITASTEDTASNTSDIRDMPPIRDNPDMAATTARRRSSVAHPHSIKYRDPGVSGDETTTEDDEDDEDSNADNILSAENENRMGHANDPSISDLNDIVIIILYILIFNLHCKFIY